MRIRYFADNNATGYATGIDLRLFGEMIKGADSWITLSYLNTKENIKNDFYYTYYDSLGNSYSAPQLSTNPITDTATNYPGFIRRPTDQAIFVSLFFQDYLEKHKRFKVHLNLVIGTGLPFGPPDRNRYKDVLKVPPYRRLDIGFSALLLNGETRGTDDLTLRCILLGRFALIRFDYTFHLIVIKIIVNLLIKFLRYHNYVSKLNLFW